MNQYFEGTAIEITKTITVDGTPTDPTNLSFFLRRAPADPVEYEFSVAPEVTNDAVGVYTLHIPGSQAAGYYTGWIITSGNVEVSEPFDFEIIPLEAGPSSEVVSGPCQPWIEGSDVAQFCDLAGTSDYLYDQAAHLASDLLFRMSGRQFPGVCSLTVRPCGTGGICAGWSWPLTEREYGWLQFANYGGIWGWYWPDERRGCGCHHVSRVHLPDYPVTDITEVTIDGAVIDPATYALREYRYLDRLDTAVWPSCQDMRLELGEAGTWGITYQWGMPVPPSGEAAASQLACEIYKAMSGQECQLPDGVTQLTRQGVTMSVKLFAAWGQVNGQWATGLPLVDAFLQAVNPFGLVAPSTVWSPDLEPFPRPHYG